MTPADRLRIRKMIAQKMEKQAETLFESQTLTCPQLAEQLGCTPRYAQGIVKTLRLHNKIDVFLVGDRNKRNVYRKAEQKESAGRIHLLRGEEGDRPKLDRVPKKPTPWNLHEMFFGRAVCL